MDVPRQRNNREEHAPIKAGEVSAGWKPAKARQTDVGVQWTQKNEETHSGYKNHINADAEKITAYSRPKSTEMQIKLINSWLIIDGEKRISATKIKTNKNTELQTGGRTYVSFSDVWAKILLITTI